MVKCADCGFLASRDIETRYLEETEQEIRQEGCPVLMVDTVKIGSKFEPPICFMRSPDYRVVPFGQIYDHKPVKAEIQRERNCNLFTPWQQGFTPKEHREMLDREKMLKWQAEREDADRAWRERQEKKLIFIAGGFTILGAVIGGVIGLIALLS